MIRSSSLVLVSLVACIAPASSGALAAEAAAPAPARKINVAVVTGGHGFNQPEFLKLFEGYGDVAATHCPQKTGGELFDNIDDWKYDAIVLYNFNQKITEPQQANFLKLMDKGVGLLILHHANAAYNNWPEFWNIAGVTYHFAPWEENGVKMQRSSAKGSVKFKIHVADPNHPITKGIADYEFTDETYGRTTVHPDVHQLLTTEEPSSDKCIGWVKTYRKANVCYLQSGHDPTAYAHPTYRTMVVRAIRWVTGRPTEPSEKPAAPASSGALAAEDVRAWGGTANGTPKRGEPRGR